MNFQDRLAHWDRQLKSGLSRKVAEDLRVLHLEKVPRVWRWQAAKISRRAGETHIGLRLLAPIVRVERRRQFSSATQEELAEYSALLIQVGAVREALNLIREIKAHAVPDVLLYQSYGFFSRWDYALAIPLIERYLASPLESYARLVGQINLAASYVIAREDLKAEALLRQIIESPENKSYRRILGNGHELLAQLFISAKEWARARESLETAKEFLAGEQSSDAFFVRKWTAVLQALQNGDADPLLAFRDEAERRGEWETLRETDLYLLRALPDEDRLRSLFFGTPYAAYRARIENHLGCTVADLSYVAGQGDQVLDLATGTVDGLACSPPALVRQIFQALGKDFYRPLRLAALFGEIFPKEYFDVNSSPNRINQAISRTRRWLTAQRVSLRIESSGQSFRLNRGSIALRVPRDIVVVDNHQLRLAKLRSTFQSRAFSPQEGRSILELPASSFKKFVASAVGRRELDRTGSGTAVFYHLKSA